VSLVRHIRNSLFQGFLYLLPIWISVAIVVFVLSKISSLTKPLIREALAVFDIVLPAFPLSLISLVISLFLIYLLGVIGKNLIGKKFLMIVDRTLLNTPLLKSIYSGTKQVIDAFTLQKKSSFREIVAVQYPRAGVFTIGFVTKKVDGMTYVFLPTTPNPTSGWLVVVPDADIYPLDMTLDDAIKLIVSGGIVGPAVPPGRLPLP
jgi:uncharacterized membrane protein